MYQLYYSAGTCSMAVHTLLNDIDVPFELVNASLYSPELKAALVKVNPRGQVPALIEDGKTLVEGAAILTYLADKHKAKLLPQSGWERAKALELLAYANSSLHPLYGACFRAMRVVGKEAFATDAMTKSFLESIQKAWDDVEQKLSAGAQYLAGDAITIGDVLITVIANWTGNLPATINFGAKTKAYFTRVTQYPAYAKALKAEQVEYKAAA